MNRDTYTIRCCIETGPGQGSAAQCDACQRKVIAARPAAAEVKVAAQAPTKELMIENATGAGGTNTHPLMHVRNAHMHANAHADLLMQY